MPTESRKNALILSGGGGRGAYHVGVMRFLEEHEWFPNIVAGTSIGAVNGAAIASGHNSRSLWALWQRLTTEDVQKHHWNLLDGNYLLDTAPLRSTLREQGWVNFERINSAEAAVHLRVTATEINSGQLHVFGNSDDSYPSRMRREKIELNHIIASCSIPIVYPATQLNNTLYWDGATVANTPLGPAIDAGAEEIVVVIMTPWESDEGGAELPTPKNILTAASTMLEWALLASFQSDLKMFRRINELIRLQVENARLQATNRLLLSQLRGEAVNLEDKDGNGIPDILEDKYHALPEPIIVAPQKAIPVDRIIRYTREGHEELFQMGYEDARRAWKAAGKAVEGES
ncbi:MAG: patatin-like phospholipase family protein [Anaerolineaceae bacterium]|nr:patatin-like phospholipase family protein [Anaerolineaceae bacterium]